TEGGPTAPPPRGKRSDDIDLNDDHLWEEGGPEAAFGRPAGRAAGDRPRKNGSGGGGSGSGRPAGAQAGARRGGRVGGGAGAKRGAHTAPACPPCRGRGVVRLPGSGPAGGDQRGEPRWNSSGWNSSGCNSSGIPGTIGVKGGGSRCPSSHQLQGTHGTPEYHRAASATAAGAASAEAAPPAGARPRSGGPDGDRP